MVNLKGSFEAAGMDSIYDAQYFLFDLDGTLADSLSVMFAVYTAFSKKYAFTPTTQEFDILNGPSLSEIVEYLAQKHRLHHNPESLQKSYEDLITESYLSLVQPFSGASELLRKLHKSGKRLFLVTSSSKINGEGFLRCHGWEQLFEGAVYGDEVKSSKPHSEIYQQVLSRYSLNPRYGVAVEDSINGVKSATGAGLFTVGINQDADSLLACGASIVFPALADFYQEVNCA
ncbi:putative Inorganic diphosphatase [Pseudodesulfovibrio piezophilus C1TLV30]|uniref:phosphoglycolate phosphatase n=2 Tax=Pseudodesulfovibrio TaxID=2035811 RepID=M1WLX0_PSEP2|nr:putative Inorganic diphosphatase [Pseudodesulfovibrio piezophilus C1TLV30]